MSQYRALISCPLIHDSIENYRNQLSTHGIEYDVPEVNQRLSEGELLEIINRYDGVIAGDDQFTEKVLQSADRLKVISKWGIGTDDINETVAEREGIDVYNTPGAFDDEVAAVVTGYAVMLSRKLHQIDKAVRTGEWYCPRGTSLAGKTAGIVGLGSIGSAVARRLHGLGMDLVGYDIEPISDTLTRETGIESASLDELFKRSTLVSLNCPLTNQTKNMVGESELESLGPDGYIINTSRGGLIKQEELVESLETGTIAGAALDVFAEEPLPTDSPLTERSDVILGSHNAQNTHEAVKAVNERAVQNLIKGLTE